MQAVLQLAGPLLMMLQAARQKAEQQGQEKLWVAQQLPLLLWLCPRDPGGASAVLPGLALPVRAPFLESQPEHPQCKGEQAVCKQGTCETR